MGSVARRVCRALQDPGGPAQFPGRLEMLPFTSVIYQPSSNSVLKCEVLKAEDLRQPQLIEFEIRSLGFCLGHKPGCQKVSLVAHQRAALGSEPGDSFLQSQAPPHTLHAVCMPHTHRHSWPHRIPSKGRKPNHRRLSRGCGQLQSFTTGLDSQDLGHGEKGVFSILSEGTAAFQAQILPNPTSSPQGHTLRRF